MFNCVFIELTAKILQSSSGLSAQIQIIRLGAAGSTERQPKGAGSRPQCHVHDHAARRLTGRRRLPGRTAQNTWSQSPTSHHRVVSL
jgi:hypothetical protein